MSKNGEQASDKALVGQKRDSVFDFLSDAQRIGSFLAQFDDAGHLQQITESETAGKHTRRGFKVSVGGGATVLGTGGSGNLGFERGPAEHGSEQTQRVYDPLWTNALTLLDYLETENLICRDVTAGHLGQFVLASGALSVLNASLLPKIWESTHIRNSAITTAVNGQKAIWNANPTNKALPTRERNTAEKAFLKLAENNSRAAMDILPSFPHSAQCTVAGKDFSVWSSLATEGMVGTVADLSLKHGTDVPGVWHLLGILDAQPSPIPAQINTPYTGVPTHFETMIRNFSNLARTALGRPPEAYGVTALLLFRQVSTGGSD
jgi:hypothetical protein